MPAGFNACVKAGGRVRTKTLKDGKYIHICFKGDKSYAGHVKTKDTKGNNYSEGLKHE